MHGSKALATGIAAALVPVCVVAPESTAAVLYTQSDLIAQAPTTRFVALVHQELHRPPRALLSWGTGILPAGLNNRDVAVDSPPGFDSYTLIGLDSVGGVFVSFSNPAAAIGQPFSSVFPGFSEAQVADAILTGDSSLTDFMNLLDTMPSVGTSMGLECRTVHFSDGADYGSFIADFSPVPAPGATMVVMLGGVFSLRRA